MHIQYNDKVLQHGYIGRRAWNRRVSGLQQHRMGQQVEDRTLNDVEASSSRIEYLPNEVDREALSYSDAVG